MNNILQIKLENIEKQLQELREKWIYSTADTREILKRQARALSIQREKLLHDR